MNTRGFHDTGGNHDGKPDAADLHAGRIRPEDGEVEQDQRPHGEGEHPEAGRNRTAPADGVEADGHESPPRHKRIRRVILIAAALAVVAVGAAFYYVFEVRPYESTDDAFIDGHLIAISPQVSARVAAVHVDDNQFVHKGDLLVELDPTDFEVALRQAQAAEAAAKGKLEQARAAVGVARSAIEQSRATIESSQATLDDAEANLKRYQGLTPAARSRQDLDKAVANQKTAAAAADQTKAQLQAAESQLTSAEANVVAADGELQKARADTQHAQVNLGYCRIVAPEDGRVTEKSVEHGALVTPAGALLRIVPLEVWVTANFKETQLTHMRTGQDVRVSVDAYPDMDLWGTVDSIQAGTGSRFSIIPAENATGNFVKVVQRVPVKIRVVADKESTRLLAPGLSVEPSVRVR